LNFVLGSASVSIVVLVIWKSAIRVPERQA